MNKLFWNLGFLVIFIFSFYLRFVNLATNPPHLGNDEISIAFDSYSIRTIGRDEHGKFLPLSFMSHRTYKAPLYAYLNVPFNLMLGNTEYGIRFLSVISGVILVFVVTLLVKNLLGNLAGLLAGLLMAINPRSITASRIGFEANLAVWIMTLGIWWMYQYKQTQKKVFVLLAGLSLGVSIWGYHTQWGLAPLLAIVLPFLWRKEISWKKWIAMWGIIIVVATPILVDFVIVQRRDLNNRASSQIWFSDGQLKDYLKKENLPLSKKVLTVVMAPVYNYLEQIDLEKMFGDGLDLYEKTHSLEFGWFYLTSLPMLIIGVWKGKEIFKKNFKWILIWWLLCPIIPAMTSGGVTSVRNLSMLVPVTIFMAGGWWWMIKNKQVWGLLLSGFLVFDFFIFTRSYYIQFPKYSADGFQYGYKQAWEYIKPIANNYQKIVVEPKFGIYGQYAGVPHLYFGYFKAFPVEAMQKRIDEGGLHIDKFYFTDVDWNKEILIPNSLYVVSVINPKAGLGYDRLKLLTTIQKPNGDDQFLIYEYK